MRNIQGFASERLTHICIQFSKSPAGKLGDMDLSNPSYPLPVNEPVLSYAPGSPERARLKAVLNELKATQTDVPMIIGGKEVRTSHQIPFHPPHEIAHTLGHYHQGEKSHVEQAIQAALGA